MKKLIYTFSPLIFLVLIGLGFYIWNGGRDQAQNTKTTLEVEDANTSTSLERYDSPDFSSAQTNNSKYIVYSPESFEQAAKNGRIVLFFHASWCPTCQETDQDINKNFLEIPSDLTILQVDYDESIQLKKKYNVNYQHTFVQVDAEGNMIQSWNGGGLDKILERVE